MFFTISSWIIIGFLAGIMVNFVLPKNRRYSLGTIGAAIIGAFVGGVVYSGIKIGTISAQIDPVSMLIAFLGSLLLIIFVSILIRTENPTITKTN